MTLLEMTGISKAFFGVPVLKDVSLTINEGEILALLGENGAGKSTLMNILAGVYTKDSGKVVFDGKELRGSSVKESETAGIAFVHQEINIFPELKVYENIFLTSEIVNRYRKLNKKQMIRETHDLMKSLGVEIDPTAVAGSLSTGEKQLIEIAKAIKVKAKLIILDEPTTALSNIEIDKLFSIIKGLKEKNTSFIFISHKMPEIFKIADTYVVLRNGEFIEKGKIAETNSQQVTLKMVGNTLASRDVYEERSLGDNILEVRNLSGINFQDVSFELRSGEILGITGLQGAGCSEVLQTIFGVLPQNGGSVLVNGKKIKRCSIQEAMKNGVAMLPANRKENSIIPDLTILENTYVSKNTIHRIPIHINKKEEIRRFLKYQDSLNIKAQSYNQKITSLSGGNQQKVILARILSTEADILLLDNPTQGVDVGAKSEIYKLIIELSKAGKSVIVNTIEIPELRRVADRCIVFYHGKIVGELKRNEILDSTVMMYATQAINTNAS